MPLRPIGIFDSGIGGLNVLCRCKKLLGGERFIYLADGANMPYGERSAKDITRAAMFCASTLVAMNVKAIVVACNTATETAIDVIRAEYPGMIVIGMEPAIKPCLRTLRGGYALALVTVATARSARFARLADSDKRITVLPCRNLARLIEDNIKDLERIRGDIYKMLTPFSDAQAVILGCSHYASVSGIIDDYYGGIKIYDGADGVAAQLFRRLKENSLLAPDGEEGSIRFYSTYKP